MFRWSALPVAHALLQVLLAVATPAVVTAQWSEPEASDPPAETSNHMFGVLPNYLTTDGKPGEHPLTSSQKFAAASRNTFDPFVYPLVGIMSATHLTYGGGIKGYTHQYAASFTDDVVGNLLTSAALPSLLGQDPRYYRHPDGHALTRTAYALTRTLVSHGDNGHMQLNVSELGGTALASTLSNAYYRKSERTASATATRMGLQMMWDGLSNVLKEFWPDINTRLHKH